MSLDQYDKIKVIGRGSYGEVWLSKHKKDRKQYVLKKMDLRKASKRERTAAEQEAQLLSSLKHPNIVAYKESFEADNGFLYIAMGFCEGGDLYSRLKEQKGVLFDERQVVEWFIQIAMALQYMHGKNIMHRDLKTQNIFLTKSKVIKVGDLGIARVLDNATDMATTMIGTPYYMSPELFSNKPYNFKSDVWALGCCVYEMTTLKHAFNGKDMNALMYRILRGKMPPMPKVYSEELVNLIRAMLNKTAEKRPSVNRILRDPYIKKNIALFLEETQTGSSSRRGSANGSKERPSSAPVKKVGQSEVEPGNARSPTKAKRVSRPPVVAESLEPLNFGPDLEPIKEEPTPRESFDVNCLDGPSVSSHAPVYSNVEPASRPLPSPLVPRPRPSSAKNPEVSQARPKKVVSSSDSATASGSSASCSNSSNDDGPLKAGAVSKLTDIDTPRSSMSARERRRKQKEIEIVSRSVDLMSFKSSDGESARQVVSKSYQLNHSDRNGGSYIADLQRMLPDRVPPSSVTHSSSAPDQLGQPPKQRAVRPDDDSSTGSSSDKEDGSQNVKKNRNNRDMKDLISLLSTTLQQPSKKTKPLENDADAAVPVVKRPLANLGMTFVKSSPSVPNVPVVDSQHPDSSVDEEHGFEPHMGEHLDAGISVTTGGRLLNRIIFLRKDCIQWLGVSKLKKAYDIIDKFRTEEVEPHLLELLGQEDFDEYAGKIYQLKFYEESAFGASYE